MLLEPYKQELEEWRASLDKSLKQENSWLALAGLIWLESGYTAFGSRGDNRIHLDSSTIAPVAGEFHLSGENVDLHVHTKGDVLVDGESLAHAKLRPDSSGNPQRITVDSFCMMLIERGGRLGIRLWNNARPERKMFPGRSWYPIDLRYRVMARLMPHPHEHRLMIPNVLGEVEETDSMGYVEFEIEGLSLRLEALEGPDDGLFLIFKDASSGSETYKSGRFLTTSPVEQAYVELDFNRAYNPPCAFTRYATCPLPPEENVLPIAITAGEKNPAITWSHSNKVSH